MAKEAIQEIEIIDRNGNLVYKEENPIIFKIDEDGRIVNNIPMSRTAREKSLEAGNTLFTKTRDAEYFNLTIYTENKSPISIQSSVYGSEVKAVAEQIHAHIGTNSHTIDYTFNVYTSEEEGSDFRKNVEQNLEDLMNITGHTDVTFNN